MAERMIGSFHNAMEIGGPGNGRRGRAETCGAASEFSYSFGLLWLALSRYYRHE